MMNNLKISLLFFLIIIFISSCKFKDISADIEASYNTASTRTVKCPDPPDNSEWNDNDANGKFTQNWDGYEWEPASLDSKYSLTAGICCFKCKENYTWKDSLCVADTQEANCSEKPDNSEWNDNGANGKFTQTWDGFSWFPEEYDSSFSTVAGSCCFKCKENYTWNNMTLKCVADTREHFCSSKPENTEWNDNEGDGKFTQTWDGSSWVPASLESEYGTTAGTCRFKCKKNYTWIDSVCVADTQKAYCSEKPDNSGWNDNEGDGKFIQTWNGYFWIPASFESVCSETAGTCHFKCNESYHCENNQCIFNTKTNVACSGLPNGATWNKTDKITQTWNGEAWEPDTTVVYSEIESTDRCYYKCGEHYSWNGSICKADTQDSDCLGLPENAEWNSASAITQTWNGSSWQPPANGTYNAETSSNECRFKCVEDYFWNGNKCIDPCSENPCEGMEYSTEICIGETAQDYSCECDETFVWNGIRCRKIGVICTGQQKCYDNSYEIPCPVSGADFFGQDAQYVDNGYCLERSFSIDNSYSGQKIVIDNNTDLEWAQLVPTSKYTWPAAKKYCEDSDYGGHKDWRLPTPKELLSIIDNSKDDPAIDSSYFPNHENAKFWTSMQYASDSERAWLVDFLSGSADRTDVNELCRVSCVRGNLIKNDFLESVKCGENIVTDGGTGLMWTATYVQKTWKEALDYCENLNYACYDDWRLPNKNELVSLLNHENIDPASTFPDMPGDYFWSSTSDNVNKNNAWYVGFSYGNVYNTSKITSTPIYVRCVR